jgi:hypothetical protein
LLFIAGEVVIVTASYYPGSYFLMPFFLKLFEGLIGTLNIFWLVILAFLASVIACMTVLSILWFRLLYKHYPSLKRQPGRGTRRGRR